MEKTKNKERCRKWYLKNKERLQQFRKDNYEEVRQLELERERKRYSEETRKKKRDYMRNHQEQQNERHRIWKKKNWNSCQEYQRDWKIRNRDKVSIVQNRRRCRKAACPAHFTVAEWKNVKAQFDHSCLRCHRKEPQIKLTVDHVVPLSKGGIDTIENIQPLCGSCNSFKRDKILDFRIS